MDKKVQKFNGKIKTLKCRMWIEIKNILQYRLVFNL